MFARQQLNLALRDIKQVGQKTDQVFIGLAVYGWGSDPDFQTLTVGAVKCIPAGLWLDMDGENQVVAVPPVPGGRHAARACSH